RGQWIWEAERAVHLPSETVVQLAFVPHPLIVQALNLYYAGLHFVVVLACLIWVYVRHRRHYPQVRTTLVLFTAAALLVQFVPVAPPRMLPGDGMIDTAARYGQSVYGSVAGFNADPLSAMPSVHVGWALLAASGGSRGSTRRDRRAAMAASGTAERRAWVYGWAGMLSNSPVGPLSTTRPRYSTAVCSHNSVTMPRLWVISR